MENVDEDGTDGRRRTADNYFRLGDLSKRLFLVSLFSVKGWEDIIRILRCIFTNRATKSSLETFLKSHHIVKIRVVTPFGT